jgi:hypothetical protein
LRLRADIWERMKTILRILNMTNGVKEYERIFHFTEPMRSGYNVAADRSYSTTILEELRRRVLLRGMSFDFPNLIGAKCLDKNRKSSGNKNQATLMNYM